jgi:hypothetical protein
MNDMKCWCIFATKKMHHNEKKTIPSNTMHKDFLHRNDT